MEISADSIVEGMSNSQTASSAPESDPGLISAADDALKAISANDATSFSNALKAHYEMCKAKDYEKTEA